MSFAMFVTWVLVGVLGGVLAGSLLKRGGYGLKRDIILGLVAEHRGELDLPGCGGVSGGRDCRDGRRCVHRGGHPDHRSTQVLDD